MVLGTESGHLENHQLPETQYEKKPGISLTSHFRITNSLLILQPRFKSQRGNRLRNSG